MLKIKDNTIWITSDLHLCHDKDFIYKSRGFASCEEHDKSLIKNINDLIAVDDYLFILGDVILYDIDKGLEEFSKINCNNIVIIRGNHDSDNKIMLYQQLPQVVSIVDSMYLYYGKYSFYLSHYPSLTGNCDKNIKSTLINLCGHTHTKNKFENINLGPIYHCEVDAHNNQMVLIDNIIIDMKEELYEKMQN